MKKFVGISLSIALIGAFVVGCSPKAPTGSVNEKTLSQKKELPIKVEAKVISSDNGVLNSSIKLPVFSNDKNQSILDEINARLEKNATDINKELATIAENDSKEAKKSNFEFRPYELLVDYTIHTVNEKVLSLTTLNYQYTGGAHGMSIKVPYNFDLTTGKEITLKDLFKEGTAYKNIIKEEIQKQIKSEPEKFFPDEVELFSGIKDDQNFFIENDQLFIYFGQYDIAPYSSGIIEFEIPSSILKDVISTSFIK